MASAAGASQLQEINRQELQAAIAKAVELRAIHAALTRGSNSSPASLRLPPGTSPCLARLPAEDYPVFTPSYDEEPLPGYRHLTAGTRTFSDTWGGSAFDGETKEDGVDVFTQAIDNNNNNNNKSSSMYSEQQIPPPDDQKSIAGSCLNHSAVLRDSPGAVVLKHSRRSSSTEFKAINKCNPALIGSEAACDTKSRRGAMSSTSFTDTLPSTRLPSKTRSPILSWLFPRSSKKKPKSGVSPNAMESEDVSQLFKEWGMQAFESLKRELHEATEGRNTALAEAGEMRSTLEELKGKMMQLETYCEELKKALKEAVQAKEAIGHDRHNLSRRTKSNGVGRDNLMPVTQEVMVEGFLQIVSEARLSVKHFCKILVNQVDTVDEGLTEKLDLLLEPYNLSLDSKYSRGVAYHLEALISQSLYQDFENCVFQRNGAPKSLDPHRDRQQNFSAFVALRNLSWNEVLRKGTKYHSEDFSRFCDLKMSGIVSLLNWSRPWPEQLLHSFFVSAKCIWLLHLLAFSFDHPLRILRVEENRSFDALYMEDVLLERQRAKPTAKVKIMVVPGFYVQDRVLKCKVLCRYKSIV